MVDCEPERYASVMTPAMAVRWGWVSINNEPEHKGAVHGGPSHRQRRTCSPNSVRHAEIQILSPEHWGLLASRSMIWSELFARTGMFITVLSASIVSSALVAQAMGFDDRFLLFALLVLVVTLLLGIATTIRLSDALQEDLWLVQGMNRLRNAYLHTAPNLESWFSLGPHDDLAGILLSVGPERQLGGVDECSPRSPRPSASSIACSPG